MVKSDRATANHSRSKTSPFGTCIEYCSQSNWCKTALKMHCISHPPGSNVVIRLLNNNNSIIISSSSNNSNSGHNNTTNPTDTIDETETNDFRDFLFVVLAFLSVTGCFIYLLCKCSNSWYVTIILYLVLSAIRVVCRGYCSR